MAQPVRKTVELFYDVISPYTWIAFEVLTRYQNKWQMDLKLRPFLLGAVMSSSGNQPPGMLPAKAAYGMIDLHRVAQYFQVPLEKPDDWAHVMFEKGTLSAMRFLTVVQESRPDLLENMSRELWKRIWSRDQDITQPESFMEAARAIGVSDAETQTFIEKIKDKSIKDRLKNVTQEAIDHGAFGAPTIIAHADGKEHMLFGSDRFHILADILGEKYEGPLLEYNKAKL